MHNADIKKLSDLLYVNAFRQTVEISLKQFLNVKFASNLHQCPGRH